MFWRRKKSDAAGAARGAAAGGHNDGAEDDEIAKLQRQFGIKPVSDADVQLEFQKLFGGGSGNTGLSPTTELALFGGPGANEDDEEAKILRALNISKLDVDSVSFDDDDGDFDGDDGGAGQVTARRELHGVLQEVHATAKQQHSQNDPLALFGDGAPSQPVERNGGHRDDVAARVHALKVEALALKRAGEIKEALALFRQAKELEAQAQAAPPRQQAVHAAPPPQAPVASTQVPIGASPVSAVDDDGVEVTDEDMQNPEFLAQLASMGLSIPEPVVDSAAALEAEIQSTKRRALEFKRNNQIQDALQCMRTIKELESKLAEIKYSSGGAAVATRIESGSTVVTPTSAIHAKASSRNVAIATHSYTAVVSMEDHTRDSDGNESDVEVTEQDMEDPAFAEELRKMGFDPSVGTGGGGDDAAVGSNTASSNQVELAPLSPAKRYERAPLLRATTSMDDEDLIDAFDDEDEEHVHIALPGVQTNYGTLVTETPSVAAPPSPSHDEQENLDVTDLAARLQHLKESALLLKREGKIQEAVEKMRGIKQVEMLIEHKQKKSADMTTTAPVAVHDPVIAAKFQELEQLLVDFGNRALALAKENLSVDRAKSTEWLNKRKAYAAELDTLRAKRQNPLQAPPPYRIERLTREVEVQLHDIPADQVIVSIGSVNELKVMAGRDIFVKFCLNFPSATPHEGKTGIVRVSSSSPYSTGKITTQNQFRFPVQRSRGTQRLFEIKKAHFEVWTAGTFLRNPELVARGYQELVSIRFRAPLREKEMRTETLEELHVGEYPDPVERNAISHTSSLTSPSVVIPQSVKVKAPQVSQPTTEEVASDQVDDEDPHHPDLIISYDVINEELEKIEAKLPSLHGQVALDLQDRYDSLALKKQLLEIDMQTGNLTLDMYVARLHARIKDDRKLIAKLMKSSRRTDAARVLHRVKIMEKELVGADGDNLNATDAT
ncbi:hypothetical protein FI667_g8525, partial [Globisporangium splendens]